MITLTKTYKPDLSPIADNYKWVYANLVIGADTYVFRTSCHEDLTDAQIQAWLEKKHDDFVCEVYRAMYEEAEIIQEDKEALLQAWQRWVAAGCKNGETVIPKVPWRDTHYKMLASKAQAFDDNLPSWSAVDQAVTNISNLADAKAFIRKLTRVVYWLARNKAD
jgi:hypothetical protein